MEDGSTCLVPAEELPLELPELEDYRSSGKNDTPLERATDWIELRDPKTGERLRRDANTMPQWAGSCWYYLRFCDPHNDQSLISPEAENYWMPVDLYVGGAEHAVLHLLYARFWHKVLYDLGVVHTTEPFLSMVEASRVPHTDLPHFAYVPTETKAEMPQFRPAAEEVEAIDRILCGHCGDRNCRPLVLLNANCGDILPLRRWPEQRYCELAEKLLDRFPDLHVAFTGAPDAQAA